LTLDWLAVILAAMDKELEYLESRVQALIARIKELETQNGRFAQALAEALKENAELNFRVNETRSRVAALVERLPKADERSRLKERQNERYRRSTLNFSAAISPSAHRRTSVKPCWRLSGCCKARLI
jgi:chromosome segregation ATPase